MRFQLSLSFVSSCFDWHSMFCSLWLCFLEIIITNHITLFHGTRWDMSVLWIYLTDLLSISPNVLKYICFKYFLFNVLIISICLAITWETFCKCFTVLHAVLYWSYAILGNWVAILSYEVTMASALTIWILSMVSGLTIRMEVRP